ncbi:MAG: glutathione S-transferase [Labilithrix sp.]|nr:glutathione S-transferase [Labilithrix sp.]
MKELVLVGEGFSPWTAKARWALAHHGIAHRYEEYTPIVSEPWLRVRARRMSGRVSVPHLLGPNGLSIGDSFAIAQEADARGEGAPLLPPELLEAIGDWNELSERLMRAGRSQILARTEESREVQIESLPPHMPRALRAIFAPSARLGTAYIRKKYGVSPVPDEALEEDLAAVRAAIAGRPIEPLLGRFTLADVAVATALQAVRPHRTAPVGLLPAQREAWARPELAARWEDVLAWRDAMIDRHLPASSGG